MMKSCLIFCLVVVAANAACGPEGCDSEKVRSRLRTCANNRAFGATA
jgi:hypothetical protein